MSRVLVVEDDPQVSTLLRNLLAGAGLETEGAADGASALELIGAGRFDLILLDLGLPDINGLALLDRFNGFNPRPRAIIVTGDDSPEMVLQANRGQACRYLTKPIDPVRLLEVVREVLELHEECPALEVISSRPDWMEFLIPCTIEAARHCENLLEAARRGIPVEEAESLGKAIHELLLNAIEWGGRFDPKERVRLACIRTPRMILHRITDPGPGFHFGDLSHAAVNNPPDQPAGHHKIRDVMGLRPGGFGILMARAMVDDLVYNEAHNEVIAIKYLEPGTGGQAARAPDSSAPV